MLLKSAFSYYISEEEISFDELPEKHCFGKYHIFTDSQTHYEFFAENDRACAIFGMALDVVSGENQNLAQKIAQECADIQQVLELEKNLGGKYILLYKNQEQYFILGDATCSIPIYYNLNDDFACSSNFGYIAKAKGYEPNAALQRIRKSGDISQAMPYDITPYKKIKQLLPNHYLPLHEAEAVRRINADTDQKRVSVEEATKIVAPMIQNLASFYAANYKIYCPITSGRDSRVVLAFLMGQMQEVPCYTIQHAHHSDTAQDLVIPKKMCKENGLEHRIILDSDLPTELVRQMNAIFGKGQYSLRTLQIAKTVKDSFGDGAIINGDIIGQVGKCSLHRDIPSIFATPAYFRCKLHNYSREAKLYLKKWMQEIGRSGEKVNLFDLFSIESRLGRWAGQENLIYNTIGQIYLNVFNSRSIIYTWTAVDRKERKDSILHQYLIRKIRPALLETPFSVGGKAARIAKSNRFFYLVSSYAKFYMERAKFKKRGMR